MTREETIKDLQRSIDLGLCPSKESRKMAIEALEQEQYYKELVESYEKTINKLTKTIAEQEPKTEEVIKMRDATPEERELIDKYIKSISKPTVVNFWSLEQEPCEDAVSKKDVFDEYGNYKYPSDVELTEPNTATSMPCEDAVSRQAAIDALSHMCSEDENGITVSRANVNSMLSALPSVTPQQSCEDIAKAFQFGLAFGFGEKYDEMDKVMEEVRKALIPQPKTGHWEQYGEFWEDKFKCSGCGNEQPKILCGERIIGHWSDYCPNCGAKMGEQESEVRNDLR